MGRWKATSSIQGLTIYITSVLMLAGAMVVDELELPQHVAHGHQQI